MNPVTEIDAPGTGAGAPLDEFVDVPGAERAVRDPDLIHGR
jgi:hypothetical protein